MKVQLKSPIYGVRVARQGNGLGLLAVDWYIQFVDWYIQFVDSGEFRIVCVSAKWESENPFSNQFGAKYNQNSWK
jgi:hypothetical protein